MCETYMGNKKLTNIWCGTVWPEAYATRMVAHHLQWPGIYVKPYFGTIDDDAKYSTKISQEVGKKQVH